MGCPAVTFTAFREVSWNAPLYTRLGFTVPDELTLPAGLVVKREQETRYGLPPESRYAMRLSLRWSARHAPRFIMTVRRKSHHAMSD